MNNLAVLYRDQGKYAQAEPLYIKVLELQRRVLGPEHPRRLASMNDLALLYLNQGKYAQAEALLREALNSFEKTTPEHLGPIQLPEHAGRQSRWSEEVRRGGAAATLRLSRDAAAGSHHPCCQPIQTGTSREMDRSTLSGLGKARESGRMAEKAEPDPIHLAHAIAVGSPKYPSAFPLCSEI